MDRPLKPIAALRLLAVLVTAALAAALFMPKGSAAASFLIGAALGLNVGVLVMLWQSDLEWHEKSEPDETIHITPRPQPPTDPPTAP
jgi:hypothetical protein